MYAATFYPVKIMIYICSAVRGKSRQSSPSSRGQVALLREILLRNDHVGDCTMPCDEYSVHAILMMIVVHVIEVSLFITCYLF